MKHRLLSLLVLLMVSFGSQAQSWEAPTLSLTTDEIPASAYFYHVGQKKFLTKGTTWGNHAALTADIASALLYEIQDQGEGVYKLHCAAAARTGYLGRSTESEIYTDYNNQAGWSAEFEFYKAESGYYHIRTAATSASFGANLYAEDPDEGNVGLYEMGWNSTNDDVDNSGNSLGTNVGIFFISTYEGIGEFDWAFVTEDSYALYSSQMALYNKLTEAYEMGYTEDELKAYASKLSSTDADELAAATASVEQLILDYAYNHATPDNPFDITSKIVNATLEGTKGTKPAGWECTDNALIQNNKAYFVWDDDTESASTTEYGFNNFVQDWTSSAVDPINAADIHQTITDLPQGTYILDACCIATSASASLTVSGAELYAISGVARYSTEVANQYGAVGAGNPHRISVEIVHMGGDLVIGYGFTPGYAKWWGADNFRLFYAGPVDNPGLVALTSTYVAAAVYDDEYEAEGYYYSEATHNALVTELEKAEAIMNEANSDACLAEVEVLSTHVNTIKYEIAAYAKLKAFVARVQGDVEIYKNVATLGDMLSGMMDTYSGAYDDKTATVEQINTWIADYDETLRTGVVDALPSATEENPVCISIFGSNLDYANNSTTEGWTVTTGSIESGGTYKVNYHNGEVWQNTFSCLQTISDLPAGKYTVKAKAFYRTSDNATCYDEYTAGEYTILTYLVAGDSKEPVVCQAAAAVEADAAPYSGYYETSEGSLIWVPNNQQSAEYALTHDDTFACEVSTYLTSDGDLTFGIRNDDLTEANGAWSVWTDFDIYYAGKSSSALYEQVKTLLSKASESEVQESASMNKAADTKLQNAIQMAEDVVMTSPDEDMLDAVEALKEAMAYTSESQTLIEEVMNQYTAYTEKIENGEITSDDTVLPDTLTSIGNCISKELYESNEQMQAWLDFLPAGWTAYIQFNHLGATKESPEDITPVIANASFSTFDTTGWTYEYTDGTPGGEESQRKTSTAYEFWNSTAFDINQTIVGLAEGYYHLTVNTFFRNGNNSPELAAAYAADPEASRLLKFYANGDTVDVKNIYDEAQAEPLSVDGEISVVLADATVYTPNTMISAAGYFDAGHYVNAIDVFLPKGESLKLGLCLQGAAGKAWCVMDNFTIQYLGNGDENAPDAIEGISAAQPVTSVPAIYTLTGQRVSKAVRGLYIINGKKVLVK